MSRPSAGQGTGPRYARLPGRPGRAPPRRASFGSRRGASLSRRPSRAGSAASEHVGWLDNDVLRPGGERSSQKSSATMG
ncbi:hypothetical protein C0L86_22585 [Streptomyces sp. SCA2-2]|nr:hypothetical protein C0L86_22585 [Streptomyces sp. SCA2-2]